MFELRLRALAVLHNYVRTYYTSGLIVSFIFYQIHGRVLSFADIISSYYKNLYRIRIKGPRSFPSFTFLFH
jgi:hypothetical protein